MKLALCNEVIADRSFEQQCAAAAAIGCTGLELAPFTLAADPFTLDETQAVRLAGIARAQGLAISSLHWLLKAPAGLSIATADTAVRQRTLDLMQRLVVFAAACGAPVLVHGSPAQRSPAVGQTLADAQARCEAAWAQIAPMAAQHGVLYCIEPLSRAETPVVNTLEQAAAVVDRIGSPALRTMFDLSAASQTETEPVHELLARYLASGHIAHVQLNDRNRRGPGQGDTPVAPVLRVLHQARWQGWMALEPFDYHPDPMTCAALSAAYVRGVLEGLA